MAVTTRIRRITMTIQNGGLCVASLSFWLKGVKASITAGFSLDAEFEYNGLETLSAIAIFMDLL